MTLNNLTQNDKGCLTKTRFSLTINKSKNTKPIYAIFLINRIQKVIKPNIIDCGTTQGNILIQLVQL